MEFVCPDPQATVRGANVKATLAAFRTMPSAGEWLIRNHGIEPDELLGRGRHRRVVLARSLVVHLARELTTLSFPEIARGLGRENHSTVHTAARRIERELEQSESNEGTAATPLPLQSGDNVTLRELVEQLKYDILRSSSRR